MAITYSDRISGTIYVIAHNAEHAGNQAIDYLRDKSERESSNVMTYDDLKAAENALLDSEDEKDHVYAISLDIRPATEK